MVYLFNKRERTQQKKIRVTFIMNTKNDIETIDEKLKCPQADRCYDNTCNGTTGICEYSPTKRL